MIKLSTLLHSLALSVFSSPLSLLKGYTFSVLLNAETVPPVHSTETPLCLQVPSDLYGKKKNTAELPKLLCPASRKTATKSLPTPRKSFKSLSSLGLPMITTQKNDVSGAGEMDLWIKPLMRTKIQILRNHT